MIKYAFPKESRLSNYFECPVDFDGRHYGSSEAVYQSFKTSSAEARDLFVNLTPDEAKHLGRSMNDNPEWNIDYAVNLMESIVNAKMEQNIDCKLELILTGDAELIEDTTGWHDNIWGECSCDTCKSLHKYNYLGKILMKVRKKIVGDEVLPPWLREGVDLKVAVQNVSSYGRLLHTTKENTANLKVIRDGYECDIFRDKAKSLTKYSNITFNSATGAYDIIQPLTYHIFHSDRYGDDTSREVGWYHPNDSIYFIRIGLRVIKIIVEPVNYHRKKYLYKITVGDFWFYCRWTFNRLYVAKYGKDTYVIVFRNASLNNADFPRLDLVVNADKVTFLGRELESGDLGLLEMQKFFGNKEDY